ncbi:MAG: biotin/lipoyl-containing protein [Anaerolineales bacterium]
MRYKIVVEGRTFEVEVDPSGQVWVNNQLTNVDLEGINGLPLYSLLIDHRSYEAHVETEEDGESQVVVSGRSYRASLEREQRYSPSTSRRHRVGGPTEIFAPLPGWLVEMRVSEGELVGEGDVVAVLESMKMRLELRTPQAGVVRALSVSAGREVAQGEVLAVIDNPSNKEGEEQSCDDPDPHQNG